MVQMPLLPVSESLPEPVRAGNMHLHVLPSFIACPKSLYPPLSLDPFTDISRAVPEFGSLRLVEGEEFYGLVIQQKDVL